MSEQQPSQARPAGSLALLYSLEAQLQMHKRRLIHQLSEQLDQHLEMEHLLSVGTIFVRNQLQNSVRGMFDELTDQCKRILLVHPPPPPPREDTIEVANDTSETAADAPLVIDLNINSMMPAKKKAKTKVSEIGSVSDNNNDNDGSPNPKATASFECDFEGCGKRYTNGGNLSRHKLTHQLQSVGKPFFCRWPGCAFRTNDRSSAMKHIKQQHLAEVSTIGTNEDGQPMDAKAYFGVDEEMLRNAKQS